MHIAEAVRKQREYFDTGATRPIDFRLEQLRKLKQAVKSNEQEILDALNADLGKAPFEAYETEIGIVYDEVNFALKHLRSWTKPKKVRTPLQNLPSRSYILFEPRGTALIIGPWNFPLQLILVPLIGSISAGNTSVVKPSEVASNTSRILNEIITKTFSPQYISIFEGGPNVSEELLKQKFDFIFFTGGTKIGRVVAEHAAKNLTPTLLELGGKSPCIIDQDTNLEVTARRIAWGKFLNAGQTCVAPDYVLAPSSLYDPLLTRLKEQIEILFGTDPFQSPDYSRIISDRHFERLANSIKGNIFMGGQSDRNSRYISPTIIRDVSIEDEIMSEEIFGPILPVLKYESIDDAINVIKTRPNPLSLYLFTNNKDVEKKILDTVSFGGGCVNDCLIQFNNPNLPFGGVGTSGIGAYHGKFSFDAFSHQKGLVRSSAGIDIPLRYPPYGKRLNLLRRIIK
ncbi:MAG TPA: aldehyde dehydrogenase [Acidobacteriota bacterium]|nr:aldehyde dehydrogenase [Acidobacteriota bacterium]